MNSFIESILSFRDQFNSHVMFGLGFLLLVGYGLGKLAERYKLPAITGFILAGLLLGSSVTGFVPKHLSHYLDNVSQMALGIIAVTIGSEFSLPKLKKLGGKIILITFFQLLLTFLFVFFGLLLLGVDTAASLLLGAIATATAPAATVAIVQSMRVRGEFVDYLYGIVALDDAGCVVLFSVVFAIVGALAGVSGEGGVWKIVAHGFSEIGLSLLVGGVGGFLVHFLTLRQKHRNQIMILAVAVLFLVTALALSMKVSPLLANMMMGAVIINLGRRNHKILDSLHPLTPPLYAAFFAIAGTELDLTSMTNLSLLYVGVAYITLRAGGKYLGVFLGASAAKAPSEVKNYLGLCMLPQAGVAIGLVMFIETTMLGNGGGGFSHETMNMIIGVVLFAVFINELLGPPLSKYGLVKGVLDKKVVSDNGENR